MAQLEIALFGPLRVTLNGEPLIHFEYDAARALLVYLALDPAVPRRREALAALFWPDEPEATALRNLRQVLNRLRAVIGDKEADPPFLLITRKEVQFNPAAFVTLDVAAFADCLASVRQHEHRHLAGCPVCRPALVWIGDLYQGEFLAGFSLDSLPFEEWLRLQREQYHIQVVEALRALLAGAEQMADWATAVATARRLITLEPWHEEAHRHLMAALAASNRRSAALAQYETCRRLLAEELGVDPAAETTTLYEQIRDGRFAAPKPVHHHLPLDATPFIGRVDLLAQLTGWLSGSRHRLLTIVGQGGVGKTRLALAAARAVAPAFADGVYFVPLAGVLPEGEGEADVAEQVTAVIASALSFTFAGGQSIRLQLLDYLRRKELLLLLDNIEHLLPAIPLLLDIHQAAPRVSLLVTSRERLNVQAEHPIWLAGLSFPAAVVPAAEEPTAFEAVRLFAERAGRADPAFALDANSLPDILRLCALVDGLPLALELAASWAGQMSVADMVTAVQQNLDFLATRLRDVPARHQSIRAVFSYSWQLLAPPARATLARLSVFRGGFHRQAALHVTRGTLPDLAGLVDKSLLRSSGNGRYEMHELLRQYAAEKLPVADPAPARHSGYYLAQVAGWEAGLYGRETFFTLAKFGADMNNIRQAWQWTNQQQDKTAVQVALPALARFFTITGRFQEGWAMFAEALRVTPAEDEGYGRLLVVQAAFANALGRYEEAIVLVQAVADANGELALAAECQRGAALWSQGHAAAAQTRLESTRLVAEASGNKQMLIEILRLLGSTTYRQGAYDAARDAYEQGRTLCLEIGDLHGESQALRGLAAIARNQAHYAAAQRTYEAGLALNRALGDRQGESSTLNALGDVAFYQGYFMAAIDYYEQSHYLAGVIGDRRGEAITLNNLGTVYDALGDYGRAAHLINAALQIKREIGFRRGEGWALACLGLLRHHEGEHAGARDLCRQALALFHQLGDRLGQGFGSLFLAGALAGLRELAEAEQLYLEAARIWEELGNRPQLVEAWAGLAALHLDRNEMEQAKAYAEKIMVFLADHSLDGAYERFRVYLTCVWVLQAADDGRYQQVWQTAVALLEAQSTRLADEQLRHTFRQNVIVHKKLLAEIRKVGPPG